MPGIHQDHVVGLLRGNADWYSTGCFEIFLRWNTNAPKDERDDNAHHGQCYAELSCKVFGCSCIHGNLIQKALDKAVVNTVHNRCHPDTSEARRTQAKAKDIPMTTTIKAETANQVGAPLL